MVTVVIRFIQGFRIGKKRALLSPALTSGPDFAAGVSQILFLWVCISLSTFYFGLSGVIAYQGQKQQASSRSPPGLQQQPLLLGGPVDTKFHGLVGIKYIEVQRNRESTVF